MMSLWRGAEYLFGSGGSGCDLMHKLAVLYP